MAKLSTLFIIFAIIASAHAAAVWLSRKPKLPKHKTVTIESEDFYCSFLPKKPGQKIGDSENDAIAFCTQTGSPDTPGAKEFPSGFIKSAHFASGKGYVQITGTINGDAYNLSGDDGGGQYDTKSPGGAVCSGFKNFVNLIEPNEGIFCIRCCTNTKKCKTGESTQGCKVVVPGDYS